MLLREIMDALAGHGIDPDRLAHHLEVVSNVYNADAVATRNVGDPTADQFVRQAEEAAYWAELFRS